MKKAVISLVLCVVMLFCVSSSFAETNNDKFAGVWVANAESQANICVILLKDDNNGAFTIFDNHSNGYTTGTWAVTGENTVNFNFEAYSVTTLGSLKIPINAGYMVLKFDGDTMVTGSGDTKFVRVK